MTNVVMVPVVVPTASANAVWSNVKLPIEIAFAVPAMPIMASPTHAPISFLNIAVPMPARLKYAAAQSVFDDHDHITFQSQTGGVP